MQNFQIKLAVRTIGVFAAFFCCAHAPALADDPMAQCVTSLSSDEVVELFPVAAHFDIRLREWVVPVRGRVYEPETDSAKRRAALAVLRHAIGLENEDDTEVFLRRAGSFLVDNERGKTICVRANGIHAECEPSGSNGHFSGELRIPFGDVDIATIQHLDMEVVLDVDDDRVFRTRIAFLRPNGFAVISDIDDTVKVSGVASKTELLRNTFVREFQAVEGMSDVYRALADEGVAFHYVSSSPWQLHEELMGFLRTNGFPVDEIQLKKFRWKDSSFFDLFASAQKTKPAEIRAILDRYSLRKFLLVGDSGESDAEIYAQLLRQRPKQILGVAIRHVGDVDARRWEAVFEGISGSKWIVFEDASEFERFATERTGVGSGE